MMWNWYTIDACFISEQWHIRTIGDYAGTIIGSAPSPPLPRASAATPKLTRKPFEPHRIFFIMVALELFRRFSREYDRAIKAAYYASQAEHTKDSESPAIHVPFVYGLPVDLVIKIAYFLVFPWQPLHQAAGRSFHLLRHSVFHVLYASRPSYHLYHRGLTETPPSRHHHATRNVLQRWSHLRNLHGRHGRFLPFRRKRLSSSSTHSQLAASANHLSSACAFFFFFLQRDTASDCGGQEGGGSASGRGECCG